MRKTNDYDSTFKTMKHSHKRLFISLINETFGKNYPLTSDIIEVLPSEGILISGNPESNEKSIEERDNDFLIRINEEYYLIESQVYDDDTMALRIAEYTFLAARQYADVSQEEVTLNIPHFTVLYVKTTNNTPRTTTIRYRFPNGNEIKVTENNVFLTDYSKEDIIEKRLFSLIPFYVARYENELKSGKDYEKALNDLAFLSMMMIKLLRENELSASEYEDLRDACIRIISHITDGNRVEGKAVNTMGGEIYETVSERWEREIAKPLREQIASKDEQIASQSEQIANLNEQIEILKKKLVEAETQ